MNAPPQPLTREAAAALERNGAAGQPVLAAVSGGPDSVCLLHVLHRLGAPLAIAHLDHGIRPDASDDAAFVRELADALGLRCFEERVDAPAAAEATGRSLEEAARALRYDFLRRTALREGFPWVATGHHAGDQAETVLMRVVRGTSPRGLAGIPEVRDLTGDGAVRVIRPLLGVDRADLRAFLDAEGLPWREDASNADVAHTRNRARHELLPLLEREWNPRIRDALARLASLQRLDESFLDATARAVRETCCEPAAHGGVRVHRARFREHHPAMRQRLLALLATDAGAEPNHNLVQDAARLVAEGRLGEHGDLGAGVTVENGRVWSTVLPAKEAPPEEPVRTLEVPGELNALGRHFSARWLEHAPADPSAWCSPSRQVFDAESAAPPYTIRSRRPGDRFRPLGLGGSRKLKNYLSGLGLPPSERESLPLVFAGDTLVWVVGHAVDERAVVGPETGRCVAVEVSRASG